MRSKAAKPENDARKRKIRHCARLLGKHAQVEKDKGNIATVCQCDLCKHALRFLDK